MGTLVQRALDGATPIQLFEGVREGLANLGYDQIAYVNFGQIQGVASNDLDALTATITYSDAWIGHYTREAYYEHDVLFRMAACNRVPVHWDDARRALDLRPIQKRIFDEGYDAGHRFGSTLPFHAPGGTGATLSISTSGSLSDVRTSRIEAVALAAQFHALYEALSQKADIVAPPPPLSARERECLSWVAAGKSSWDISRILSIAESTVDFHIKNTMRKLNVHSRIGAVLVAARFGELSLR